MCSEQWLYLGVTCPLGILLAIANYTFLEVATIVGHCLFVYRRGQLLRPHESIVAVTGIFKSSQLIRTVIVGIWNPLPRGFRPGRIQNKCERFLHTFPWTHSSRWTNLGPILANFLFIDRAFTTHLNDPTYSFWNLSLAPATTERFLKCTDENRYVPEVFVKLKILKI